MSSTKVKNYTINMGCDPELFFSKDGRVVGSEKLLPKDGLVVKGASKIIIDGVQVELNPAPSFCREILARNIRDCFIKIGNEVLKDGYTLDFSQAVKVTAKEMASLSPKSRAFGCSPSENAYTGESKIKVNPSKYRIRAAGGHIHLGAYTGDGDEEQTKKALHDYERLVPLLDVILGNTCVLLDRAESNIERRKVYGKAGEYRKPSYGVEYRTLSNFWLQSYPLMSFVMGMARFSVNVLASSYDNETDFASKIMEQVERKDIISAINNNDLELAQKNFNKIKNVLCDMADSQDGSVPISEDNLSKFEKLVEQGIDRYLPEDPLAHWSRLNLDSEMLGFGSFLSYEVM